MSINTNELCRFHVGDDVIALGLRWVVFEITEPKHHGFRMIGLKSETTTAFVRECDVLFHRPSRF